MLVPLAKNTLTHSSRAAPPTSARPAADAWANGQRRPAIMWQAQWRPILRQSMDIDSFWEYSDPAASEARFREALPSATADERLELLTQIARTQSLRGQMAEAHVTLDEIQPQLTQAGPRPRIRYGLERGRTYNSDGE